MDLIRRFNGVLSADEILLIRQLMDPIVDQHDDTFTRTKSKLSEVPGFLTKKLSNVVEESNRHFGFDIFSPVKFESFTYGRYGPGDSCAVHNDIPTVHYFTPETRKLSVVIGFNNGTDYDGGDFVFSATTDIDQLNLDSIHEIDRLKLNAGDVVIYPGFVYHEVQEVTAGFRESLTTMVLGPRYK